MNEPQAAASVASKTETGASCDVAPGEQAFVDESFRFAPIPILIEDWSLIKQRMDALRQSGVQDLDAYLDAHPGAIEELRALHAFVDANDATLSLFGAPSKEVFFAWARELLPANRISNAQVLRAIFEGQPLCEGERTLSTLDGRKVPIVWRCSLPEETARYRRLHFFAFDVTEHKRNSERLQVLQAEMARTARVSMVGQLVASITHEIGQPLGAIRTALDAAIRWLDRPQPEIDEALVAFRYASRWTDDMAAICRRLRSFLVSAPVEAVELDCADIVDSAMRLIASEANARAIPLVAEIEPGIKAYADRIQLQQVLTNLLINGIHAIEAAASTGRQPLLRVCATRDGATHTRFEVIDTGCGIGAEQADAIFQPFSSTKSDGMGMGLPISKSIVEAHGGRIWIASTGDEGTRFCFTLPRCRQTFSRATQDAAGVAGTGHSSP